MSESLEGGYEAQVLQLRSRHVSYSSQVNEAAAPGALEDVGSADEGVS
jgi:hypothetical protein